MTKLTENAAPIVSRLPSRLDAALAASSQNPLLWITLVWALLVLPGFNIRGAYFEEQTIIGLARGALEDGWWLSPHLYGVRFIERPVLLSWLVAALSWPVGSIIVPVARLPTVISGLAGAILVYSLVKQRTSSIGGLVASLCFLASPGVFQVLFTAEPDLMLSVLIFSAFVVWWDGEERDKVTVLRWSAIGLLLTAAALAKGPQPLAFFFLGVFAYLIIRREWRRILGLGFSGILPAAATAAWYYAVYEPGDLGLWRHHSRLYFWQNTLGTQLFELLDLTVRFIVAILPSAIIIAIRRPSLREPGGRGDLLSALLLYASLCTVLLWFWPGARYRYAMPAFPAFAAAAGILFDDMRLREDRARYIGLYAIAALIGFQVVVNWLVMTNLPDLFAKSRLWGRTVAAVLATAPATLYAVYGAADDALLVYVPPPIRRIPLAGLSEVKFPAWALLTPEQTSQLQASRPDLNLQLRLVLSKYDNARLFYIDRTLK
ncbi:MAG TPA: glycosyltransferase family 39 protein [Xanthobacteraceae bacterium]|nr:glycosyltransferase family 39 protein [Xanthobacteraceae bacterium]